MPARPTMERRAYLVGLAAVAFVAGLTGIREFDSFHHLAVGRQLLGAGFGGEDPFLFTRSGEPGGPPFYWLGSLAFYAAHAIGGIPGVVLLVGLAGAVTFALLGLGVLDAADGQARAVDLALALVPLGLALGAWRLRAVTRPEVLGLALFAWTLLAVRRASAGRDRAVLLFPLVAAVWSNMHISVAFGVAAVALGTVEALWRARGLAGEDPNRVFARRLALAALLGVAATFANPGGGPLPLAARFGRGLLAIWPAQGAAKAAEEGIEVAQSQIIEMQPMGWEYLPTPVAALLVVGVLSYLAARRLPRATEAALLLGLTLLSVRATRFVPWGAVAWATFAGGNLVVARRRWLEGRAVGRGVERAIGAAGPLLAAAAIAWSFAYVELPVRLSVEERLFPVRATEVLESASAGARSARLYDWIGFGGWLEWRLPGVRVYQDGRLWWPPGEARGALAGPSLRPAFAKLDRRWRFDGLVLRWPVAEEAARFAPGADAAADRDLFALVALDDGGLLYVRRDGVLAGLAEREYRVLLPARAPALSELLDPEWLSAFRGEAERALRERPRCDVCRGLAWLGAVAADDEAAAEAILPGGALPEPVDPFGHGGLESVTEAATELGRIRFEAGVAAAVGGDLERAAAEYRRSLRAFESAAEPHFELGRILLATGERAAAERHLARAVELAPSLADSSRALLAPR